MRPFTNRGLRRKRPQLTRSTVTRIVSSLLPSLPTDTGAGYMSLSTRPFPCRFARARESAIRVPTSVHHRPLEYVVDGADREDRNRSTRRAMDSRRPDELHAVLVVEILDEQHRIVLRPMTEAVDRIDAEHLVRRCRAEVVPRGRRILDDLPSGIAAQMRTPIVDDHDADVPRGIVVVQVETGRNRDVGRRCEYRVVSFHADYEDRIPGPRDELSIDELTIPDAGRPLPLLEIGDLHRLAFERVPPFVRRESGVPDRALGLVYRRSRSLEQGASQTDSETAGRRRSARGETELDQIPPGPRSRRLRIVVLRQSRSLRSSRIGAGERKCADRLKVWYILWVRECGPVIEHSLGQGNQACSPTNRQSMRITPSAWRIERSKSSAHIRPTVARRMNTA